MLKKCTEIPSFWWAGRKAICWDMCCCVEKEGPHFRFRGQSGWSSVRRQHYNQRKGEKKPDTQGRLGKKGMSQEWEPKSSLAELHPPLQERDLTFTKLLLREVGKPPGHLSYNTFFLYQDNVTGKQKEKWLSNWVSKMSPLPTEAPASLLNPSRAAASLVKANPSAPSALRRSPTKLQRQHEEAFVSWAAERTDVSRRGPSGSRSCALTGPKHSSSKFVCSNWKVDGETFVLEHTNPSTLPTVAAEPNYNSQGLSGLLASVWS